MKDPLLCVPQSLRVCLYRYILFDDINFLNGFFSLIAKLSLDVNNKYGNNKENYEIRIKRYRITGK